MLGFHIPRQQDSIYTTRFFDFVFGIVKTCRHSFVSICSASQSVCCRSECMHAGEGGVDNERECVIIIRSYFK